MFVRCEKITQSQKYNGFHRGISRTPFNAMFGENRYADHIGKDLPNDVWEQLEGEEDLAEALGVGSVGEEERNEVVERSDNTNDSYEQNLLQDITDEPLEVLIQNKCSVCEIDYEGSTQCSICSIFCPNVAPCSFSNEDLELICQLCKNKDDISIERNSARSKQVRQAEKMLSVAAKRFKPSELGDNVSVPIPDVDQEAISGIFPVSLQV